MPQIVIANSLADGFVVFLTASNGWSSRVRDAAVAHDDADAEALLRSAKAAAENNVVIDPYLIAVELKGNAPEPTEYREYIRVFGPSVAIPSGQ